MMMNKTNMKNITNDPGLGVAVAVGLSINDALFYDIFHAGDIFEHDSRYSISNHLEITDKAYSICPDFIDRLLPIFCDIYSHAKSADNGIWSGTLIDECQKAQFVTDYTNAHPELPDAWDFMEVYFDMFKNNEAVIVLPNGRKIVMLNGITIEQILKS